MQGPGRGLCIAGCKACCHTSTPERASYWFSGAAATELWLVLRRGQVDGLMGKMLQVCVCVTACAELPAVVPSQMLATPCYMLQAPFVPLPCHLPLYSQLNLRNGALRKKFDALKYTLRKLEVRQAPTSAEILACARRCSWHLIGPDLGFGV
jgi:hypothetical protein